MKRLLLALSIAFACSLVWAGQVVVVVVQPAAAATSGISFVAAESSNFSGTQSPSVLLPTVAENDIMFAIFSTDTTHASTGTPPTGWTRLNQRDTPSSDQSGSVFWKRAGASESSPVEFTTVFTATESGIAVVVAYRGCTTSGSPVNTTGGGTGSSTADWTTSVTPSVLSRTVCIFTADQAEGATATWAAGTERIDSDTTPTGQNSASGYVTVADDEAAASVLKTMSATASAADEYAAFIYALTPD